jgi:hypothetical protein
LLPKEMPLDILVREIAGHRVNHSAKAPEPKEEIFPTRKVQDPEKDLVIG